jgi:hypothetical protein
MICSCSMKQVPFTETLAAPAADAAPNAVTSPANTAAVHFTPRSPSALPIVPRYRPCIDG